MEWVRGDLLGHGSFGTVNLGISKSQSLQCIHENGFVHCDLKLQNVLLCQNDVAKIADFGLAKKSGEKIVGFELRGTPMYMPPETVVAGQQEAAADVWALGCLVAEMVAGTPPWLCDTVKANSVCVCARVEAISVCVCARVY
ncbi:unnamed protein product [Camellia sinensis]